MVNTLVLYDVATRRSRARLEALLRQHGFMWLFPNARWSERPFARHDRLALRVRACLRTEAYRVVFIQISAKERTQALWLTSTKPR
jgi:CRISPR/Cas system-associated endoribonuclease Cas2